jgi:3-hydroxyacyl-[acyl-carrier-protein] dehydratase
MGKLARAIKECMSDLRCDSENILSANFIFDKDFLGFKGHFPDKAILPGICKIQAAILMFEEFSNKSAHLKEVVLAKFFSPVSANEPVVFSLERLQEGEDEYLLRVKVSALEKKVADLQLRVILSDR